MITSWVLLLSLLGGSDELYVYVENDPQVQSQHVLDALETSLEELVAPNLACQVYLDELEWDRCALLQEVDLHILTRDEAKLSSAILLPGYAFTPRENPVPLHPQCYLHFQLVPEHLLYVTRIRRHNLKHQVTWGERSLLGFKLETGNNWFYWETEIEPLELPVEGKVFVGTRETTTYRLLYEPCPPIGLPWPVVTLRKGKAADGSEVYVKEKVYCTQEHLNLILKEADMGTGYIHWVEGE